MNSVHISIGLVVFLAIGLLSSNIINTTTHEEIHKQIATYYGCLNGTINYSDFYFSGEFRCLEYKNTVTQEMRKDENILQSVNEIVGYNIMILSYLLLYGVGIIAIIIIVIGFEIKRGDKNG